MQYQPARKERQQRSRFAAEGKVIPPVFFALLLPVDPCPIGEGIQKRSCPGPIFFGPGQPDLIYLVHNLAGVILQDVAAAQDAAVLRPPHAPVLGRPDRPDHLVHQGRLARQDHLAPGRQSRVACG